MSARRDFLKFLTASPLLSLQAQEAAPITDPKLALNVMDFEAAARKALPPAHFGYLTTGVDDDRTVRANHEAYLRIQLRPRRMVDVSRCDTSVTLFANQWRSPLFLSPCGSQRAFHPDGELATGRAAGSRRMLLMHSTAATVGIEEVGRAVGGPVWQQLYPTSKWAVTETLVRRGESAGCPVLVITVDVPAGRNTETQKRFAALDTRKCATCHSRPFYSGRKAMFEKIDTEGVGIYAPAFTWESVRRVRAMTRMKIVLKGLETGEDARIAVEQGVDGIVISNHGGRAEESGRATIECLPEIADAVRGRIPVMIDGGVRRGGDIFKAIALGANAVGIGRPYLWGLAAFGQPGIERVLDILQAEFELCMKQCGARSIAEIKPAHVLRV